MEKQRGRAWPSPQVEGEGREGRVGLVQSPRREDRSSPVAHLQAALLGRRTNSRHFVLCEFQAGIADRSCWAQVLSISCEEGAVREFLSVGGRETCSPLQP